jgi:nicotinamidase/pyrazinamidase
MNALILVDIQKDFLPGGALPVPKGDEIIPAVNTVLKKFELVVATQDWHPPDHASFASNHPGKKIYEKILLGGLEQVLWPDHCVQGSTGAAFADRLYMDPVEAIFRKGTDPAIDSYSGFFDNGHLKSTGMADYLKGRKVDRIFVCGLAAEYCVYFTIMDGLILGYKTVLIGDATRALDEGDFQAALKNIKAKGGKVISSREILKKSAGYRC